MALLLSPVVFVVLWLLLLFGGCPAASGATTTATSSYRIQLVNGDVTSKWCKIGDSGHGFTQIMLEPGQSAEMQFPRPSDGAIQVYNPASGWAGHTINAGDTLLLTWSYAEGLNAHFSPASSSPSAEQETDVDGLFMLVGQFLALGVIVGGLIFASRFLWRLFQRLLGGPTFAD